MNKKKILNEMYERVIEELPPTKEYKRIAEQVEQKKEDLLDKIGKEYSDHLEEIADLICMRDDELDRQVFYTGFSLAVRLFVEATYKD